MGPLAGPHETLNESMARAGNAVTTCKSNLPAQPSLTGAECRLKGLPNLSALNAVPMTAARGRHFGAEISAAMVRNGSRLCENVLMA